MSEISNSITSNMHKQTSKNYNILLNNIKHDLTNPINAILGFSELILDYLKEGADGQLISDVKNIHKSGSLLFENIKRSVQQNPGIWEPSACCSQTGPRSSNGSFSAANTKELSEPENDRTDVNYT